MLRASLAEQTPSWYLKLRLNVSAASPTLPRVPPPLRHPTPPWLLFHIHVSRSSNLRRGCLLRSPPQPSCRSLGRPQHSRLSMGDPTNRPLAKGMPETFGVGLGWFLTGSAGKLRPGGTEPVGLQPGTREQRQQHHPPGRRRSRLGRCQGRGVERDGTGTSGSSCVGCVTWG